MSFVVKFIESDGVEFIKKSAWYRGIDLSAEITEATIPSLYELATELVRKRLNVDHKAKFKIVIGIVWNGFPFTEAAVTGLLDSRYEEGTASLSVLNKRAGRGYLMVTYERA
jgi:hypothetical protein